MQTTEYTEHTERRFAPGRPIFCPCVPCIPWFQDWKAPAARASQDQPSFVWFAWFVDEKYSASGAPTFRVT
jgi:hypothetical protein